MVADATPLARPEMVSPEPSPAHAALNRPPVFVLVAVQPDPARRRASVDPAIEGLVALAPLLPLVSPPIPDRQRKAYNRDGGQRACQ